ncbi:MAG: rhomboid family intramembrane serine protease [Chitinophagaceae bacterium]|nr:rhomboid family intramembrane serine protease [Chitinophagaceae bacterium]
MPTVIKNLLILNALVFFAQLTFENSETIRLENWFALHDVHSVFFRPHQLITYMFLHGGFGHIFFNMFALWMFGSELENVWGPKRFLIFYMACGIGAGLLHLGVLYLEMEPIMAYFRTLPPGQQEELMYSPRFKINTATLGASGSVFGCLAAFGYLFPNNVLYIYALFPIKAKWFVILYAAGELWMGVANSAGDNVAHWAHLGGALVGIIMVIFWNKTNRRQFY